MFSAHQEPTDAALTAIEREWPLIEAELALLDAEIRILTADKLCDLDWRRVRRAEARVAREALALAAQVPAVIALGGAA